MSVSMSVPHDRPTTRTMVVMGGAFGNLIEWYDWTIFGLLASVFAPALMPGTDPTAKLIGVLLTYAVGFLMRPIGSLVLSPMADRYGRQRVLALTIILMGVGSLIVALTPSYGTIGVLAPVLLLVARLLQGFSAGGEFQGSATYLAEHAPPERRALVSSWHVVSIGLAVLLATGVAALTTSLIPQPALGSWGWRLPFLFGALMSVYGIWIRLRLPETPSFEKAEQRHEIDANPLLNAIRRHPRESLFVFVMQMGTVQFYTWTVFLPTYAHLAGNLPLSQGLIGGVIALIVYTGGAPIAAAISDRIGRKPLLFFAYGGFVILTWPLLMLLRNGDFATYLMVDIVGMAFIASGNGVLTAVLCELFPTGLRASGIGLPYAICSAIFGGTAPLIATALLARHMDWGVALYVMVICLVACIVFTFMPETRGRPLD
jgi:MHS family alpha-ketoglutarate permease-like MFS transporter